MKKSHGFTLAEVLITLGIIGVVAAMTIPTLMSNTNSAKFRSQFKKSISTLNQAGLMAQAQYDIDYGTLASASASCSTTANPSTGSDASICAIFNGTLSGHTLTATSPYTGTAPSPTGNPTNKMYLIMADGSMLVFDSKAAGCTLGIGTNVTASTFPAVCKGYIDVNGPTLPNKEVTCGGSTAVAASTTPCNVPADATHMTDIYPVAIHDGTVEPLTNAARYVLSTSK